VGALGWKPRIGLDEGIMQTYRWFVKNEPGKTNMFN
jgi:nucleoside-diphosphate-sugar epimerase